MLTRTLRDAAKREEGQALVLACLMLLVVSVAVISTVNLGHGIYERQRLQNTADSAAYSMAALEARAFNFYAFVNRTHVSHYVSAMVWQSILSFVYFVEAMVVDVLGVMWTLKCRDQGDVVGAACGLIEIFNSDVKRIFDFINSVFDTYKTLVGAILQWMRVNNPDLAIGLKIVPTYFTMNGLLTGAAEATLEATLDQVKLTSADVVMANDRNVDVSASRFAMGQLSACMLSRAHMREAWHAESVTNGVGARHFKALDPNATRELDKVSRAKRSMGAVSNATRFALDGVTNPDLGITGPGWVTSRKIADLVTFPSQFQEVHDLLVKYVDDPDAAVPGGLHLGKWGQTKMLSHTRAPPGLNAGWLGFLPGAGNKIRNWDDAPDAPMGAMAQGDDLGSDDLYRINIGDWDARWEVGAFGIGVGVNIKHFLACRPQDNPLECWGDARYERDSASHLDTRNMLKTSIWATQPGRFPGSIHHRVVQVVAGIGLFPAGWGAAPPIRYDVTKEQSRLALGDIEFDFLPFGLKLHKYVANVRGVADGNHPWHGVAPFPHFEPGNYALHCTNDAASVGRPSGTTAAKRADDEFNQPSTFAMLTKTAVQMKNMGDTTGAGNANPALLNSSGTLAYAFSKAGSKLVMDNTRKAFLSGQGLNVLSRGQAYYHRSGNWHEQPNFFNPYWRPRLASVLQARGSNDLIEDFVRQLPGDLNAYPQRMVTH